MISRFTCDESGFGTGKVTSELLVGTIEQVVLGENMSQVLFQKDSDERREVEVHTDLFNKKSAASRLSGARVICAINNREVWLPSTDGCTMYIHHELLHIIEGPHAGETFEYRKRS